MIFKISIFINSSKKEAHNMANTFVQINVHIIFHVKSSGIAMRTEDMSRIFEYIGGIIKGLGSFPMAIGGISDHIHILSTLPKTISIADYVRNIKTDSSKWIKTLDSNYSFFAWQDGYAAFSVSPSMLNATKSYIFNQAVHHSNRSFEDEYKAFLSKYGLKFDEKYLF